jgi:hypothetical protein
MSFPGDSLFGDMSNMTSWDKLDGTQTTNKPVPRSHARSWVPLCDYEQYYFLNGLLIDSVEVQHITCAKKFRKKDNFGSPCGRFLYEAPRPLQILLEAPVSAHHLYSGNPQSTAL